MNKEIIFIDTNSLAGKTKKPFPILKETAFLLLCNSLIY